MALDDDDDDDDAWMFAKLVFVLHGDHARASRLVLASRRHFERALAPSSGLTSSSACWMRSPTDFSRSSMRSPISSMRVMMLSLIC